MVGSAFRWGVLLLGISLSGCQGSLLSWNAYEEAEAEAETLECSADALARAGPLDVAVVIDASMSTREASGVDVDGDGTLGVYHESVLSDRDDSRLGAQVHAVRSLLELANAADVRFAFISFSGSLQTPIYPQSRVVKGSEARIHVPLGGEHEAIARHLDAISERGGSGTSHFYAGLRQANRALIEGEPSEQPRTRLVLFISDSHSPVTRVPDGSTAAVDPHLDVAIRQAREHDIVFHSFGLGAESGGWRFDPIGWIAWETGGRYHRVEDPAALDCHLVSALLEPKEEDAAL